MTLRHLAWFFSLDKPVGLARRSLRPQLLAKRYGQIKSIASKTRDAAIPYTHVCLVNETSGALETPQLLQQVLAQFDPAKYSLIVVNPNHQPPICKIVSKVAEQQKADAARAAVRRSKKANQVKEVQLSWTVTGHDMQHKLKVAEETLAKGGRIAIKFEPKRGSKSIGIAGGDRAKIVARVLRSLKGSPIILPNRVVEWRQAEWKGEGATLYLQGSSQ